jgi:hypothetical protein
MYSRRACGLCDEARAVILAQRERTPFAFREVFIEGDDGLERAHGLRVPVVEVDGVERFETVVDPGLFAHAVRPDLGRPGGSRLRRR